MSTLGGNPSGTFSADVFDDGRPPGSQRYSGRPNPEARSFGTSPNNRLQWTVRYAARR
jgi:hypothetical protein